MTMWTEHTIETARGARVGVRVYGKRAGNAPVALYLHGGAFTGGSVATSSLLPMLMSEAGAVVAAAE